MADLRSFSLRVKYTRPRTRSYCREGRFSCAPHSLRLGVVRKGASASQGESVLFDGLSGALNSRRSARPDALASCEAIYTRVHASVLEEEKSAPLFLQFTTRPTKRARGLKVERFGAISPRPAISP